MDIWLENWCRTKKPTYVTDEFKDALYLSLLFYVSPTYTCKYLNYTLYLKGYRFLMCNFYSAYIFPQHFWYKISVSPIFYKMTLRF